MLVGLGVVGVLLVDVALAGEELVRLARDAEVVGAGKRGGWSGRGGKEAGSWSRGGIGDD